MSDTRTLLDRIASFRQRLDQTPSLIPVAVPIDDPASARARAVEALAGHPELMVRSLRVAASLEVTEGPLPAQLTVRARRLLEDARGLVAVQRELAADPLLTGLPAESDPLAAYAGQTVALIDAALRLAQAMPASAECQLKVCDGVEAMLRAVRDRLATTRFALAERRKHLDRLDGLARRLADLAAGRAVDTGWFADLAERLVAEARQAAPLKFLTADPRSTCGHPGGPTLPAPARFVAAHALTAAQVAARVVPQDYEWAGRPLVPVVAALVMDLGMVRVPPEVLAKPGPLTPDERRLVEAHPHEGADLLRAVLPQFAPLAEAVAAHHERPDGTGYPHALKADAIPSLARLLAVCDTYAALVCDRPHRPANDPRTALTDTLLAAEHGRLDWDLTEYLLALGFHPVGTVVELTDGRVGVVAANHAHKGNLRVTARPVVAVLTDAAGAVLPRPRCVDLAAAEVGGVNRVLTAAERTKLLAKDYPDLCG